MTVHTLFPHNSDILVIIRLAAFAGRFIPGIPELWLAPCLDLRPSIHWLTTWQPWAGSCATGVRKASFASTTPPTCSASPKTCYRVWKTAGRSVSTRCSRC
ncbi:hypothetical protein BCAR13_940018 [Paraburkholderia caribensis]|nr:hypothetical protein BCAR13_940018 [Paraburkholderia caribensis]